MPRLGSQHIVDVEDVIVVFVVVPVVEDAIARLGKHPAWVVGDFIPKLWIALRIRPREMRRERRQGLLREEWGKKDRSALRVIPSELTYASTHARREIP